MEDRAVNQNPEATHKLLTLDWPTPQMLQAAHRARAKAFREMTGDMIRALGKWAEAFSASHPMSKSPRAMAHSAARIASKR